MSGAGRISTVLVILALFAAMLAAGAHGTGSADTEPNDTFEGAKSLSPGVYTGNLEGDDEDDFYNLTVGAGQTIYVNVTPDDTLIVDLRLYDPDRTEKTYALGHIHGGGEIQRVSFTTGSDAMWSNYYVRVHNTKHYLSDSDTNTSHGNYTIELAFADQGDGGSAGDAGDSLDEPLAMTAGDHTGFLADLDSDDCYSVVVEGGQTITVNVTPAHSLDVDMGLYNADREQVAVPSYEPGDLGELESISFTTNSSMAEYVYFIKIHRQEGSGEYSMMVELASQDDGGLGGDAPEMGADWTLPPTAQAMPFTNATTEGFMNAYDGDDVWDVYSVSATAEKRLTVTVTPPAAMALDIRLWNANEVELASDFGNLKGDFASVHWDFTDAQNVYILMSCTSGRGTYTLEVTVDEIPDEPVTDGGDGDGGGDGSDGGDDGGDDDGDEGGDGDDGGDEDDGGDPLADNALTLLMILIIVILVIYWAVSRRKEDEGAQDTGGKKAKEGEEGATSEEDEEADSGPEESGDATKGGGGGKTGKAGTKGKEAGGKAGKKGKGAGGKAGKGGAKGRGSGGGKGKSGGTKARKGKSAARKGGAMKAGPRKAKR